MLLQYVSVMKGHNKFASFGIVVYWISTADILFAIYLSILCIAAILYDDTFISEESDWMNSPFCFLAFMLSLEFALFSPSGHYFLSFMRMMIVKHPLDPKFKDNTVTFKWFLITLVFTVCISLVFTVLIWTIYSPIQLHSCFPFVDPANHLPMLRITVCFVVLIQVSALICIIYMHFKLVEEHKMSNKIMNIAKSRKESSEALIYQIIILTISLILSWVPSNIIYIVSMLLDKYSIEMITLTMIVVIPMNSIVTQLVFILTTTKKFHIFDFLYQR